MSVIAHLRNYASAGLLSSLLGLLSFPILTRALSVGDYGLLGLIVASSTVFVAAGKLGLQHALIRFYAAERERGEAARQALLGTVSAALGGAALLAGALWLLYSLVLVPSLLARPGASTLFLLAAALVPIKILSSGVLNLLRAEQRSAPVALAMVAEKLLRLSLIVAALSAGTLALAQVVSFTVAAELLMLILLVRAARPLLRGLRPRWRPAALAPLVVFGLPSMANELASLLLEIGDRYVIGALLGAAPLGHYAAAYNMSLYLEWTLIVALQSALIPHYVQLYERDGEGAARDFVEGALRRYVLIGAGIGAVFCAVAPELLQLLAGPRYRAASELVPWVVAALFVGGAVHLFAAGCYLHKRPLMLLKWTGLAFVLNIALNIALVPLFGLLAAAASTTACYLLRGAGLYKDARALLAVRLPWPALGAAVLAAALALGAVQLLPIGGVLVALALKGALASGLYVGTMVALSSDFRALLGECRRGLGGRHGAGLAR